MNTIKSEIQIKATASLEEEVKKELEQKDPTLTKAKAIIENNEVTTGNDGRGSH